jgi:predicted transcriptional regulator
VTKEEEQMPKLSVYVPDELWARVKDTASGEKVKNSQLVQDALEQMVNDREAERASLRLGAALDQDRLAAVVRRLRAGARAEFEEGYEGGLDLAQSLDFDDLRTIVKSGGLGGEGIDYLHEFGSADAPGAWARRYGVVFGYPGDEDWGTPGEAWAAGAEQAIADVWQALRASSWGTAPPEGSGTDDQSSAEGDKA